MVARFRPVIVVLGVGEIASAVAHRLFLARFRVLMTENNPSLELDRHNSFSRGLVEGFCEVEGVSARCAVVTEAVSLAEMDVLPLLGVDARSAVEVLGPEIVVDARTGPVRQTLRLSDASRIIGVTPRCVVGEECHFAVESARGINLGRIVLNRFGQVAPTENEASGEEEPGSGGDDSGPVFSIRAGSGGIFHPSAPLGSQVACADPVGEISGDPVTAPVAGIVKGILRDGMEVEAGTLLAEVDSRGLEDCCYNISEQGRAVSGAVLEIAVARAVELGALNPTGPY